MFYLWTGLNHTSLAESSFVNINNISSDPGFVSCGVPQGSILGSLLFLIYVNDMETSIDSDCKLILYADDSAIVYAHKDPHIISRKLGSVLDKCSTWLVNNKLSLHLGITECVLFGPKRKLSDFKDFSIVCNKQIRRIVVPRPATNLTLR